MQRMVISARFGDGEEDSSEKRNPATHSLRLYLTRLRRRLTRRYPSAAVCSATHPRYSALPTTTSVPTISGTS